jgi:hypothetical protein
MGAPSRLITHAPLMWTSLALGTWYIALACCVDVRLLMVMKAPRIAELPVAFEQPIGPAMWWCFKILRVLQ